MKKLMAVVVLGVMVVAVSPPSAQASEAAGTEVALGVIAAFSILTWPFWALAAAYPVTAYPPTYPTPVYATAQAPYYAAPAYTPAPATPAVQREVIYAHGRHVLYGDGVTTAYRWVWVASPPPPPPPAIAPPAPVPGAPPPPPAN